MTEFLMTVTPHLPTAEAWANQFEAQNTNMVAIFSTEVRDDLEEWTGKNPTNERVFQEMNRRAKDLLSQGKSVIYVAGNQATKTRMGVLNDKYIRDAKRTAVYFDIPLNDLMEMTDRKNYTDLIVRGTNVPFYGEGWDDIMVIHSENPIYKPGLLLETTLSKFKHSHEGLFELVDGLSEKFKEIYNLSYGNPEQKLTASERTHLEFELLKEQNESNELLWAALLRNTGLGFCKKMENGKIQFPGHDNVAAQIAMTVLHRAGYDDEFSLHVATLVSWATRYKQNPTKAKSQLDGTLISELEALQEAMAKSKK